MAAMNVDISTYSITNLSMQVTISDQKNNKSVLNEEELYPCGIMTKRIYIPPQGSEEFNAGKYYITINSTDLADGIFQKGQYYRVQLRFVSQPYNIAVAYTSDPAILSQHLNEYSEWSTICLIKQIDRPVVVVNNEQVTSTQAQPFVMEMLTNSVALYGNIEIPFDDDETVKSCQIILKHDNIIIETSDILVLNKYDNKNSFAYRFKHLLEDNESYIIEISYITRNYYRSTEYINLHIDLDSSTPLYTITTNIDENNGVINVSITTNEVITQEQTFVILRADSNENFQIWQEVQLIQTTESDLDWQDRIIESNVWYKYMLQSAGGTYSRGGCSAQTDPVLVNFDDIYLTTEDKQLKITLGGQVTNYKHNVMESKTDTLGGAYPIIRRNGKTKYRSFSINGTIAYIGNNETILVNDTTATATHFLTTKNMNGLFETRDSLIKATSLYDNYNVAHQIDDNTDIYLERKFREAVIEFLYDNNVKLYRSQTEGNILVRLMNISFTPKNEIGRYIYDFTAEAIEVDEFNIENCHKYQVQNLGHFIDNYTIAYTTSGILAISGVMQQ